MCLLILSLPSWALRSNVESLRQPRDSTSILKALPGKLGIKRYPPNILYISRTCLTFCQWMQTVSKGYQQMTLAGKEVKVQYSNKFFEQYQVVVFSLFNPAISTKISLSDQCHFHILSTKMLNLNN